MRCYGPPKLLSSLGCRGPWHSRLAWPAVDGQGAGESVRCVGSCDASHQAGRLRPCAPWGSPRAGTQPVALPGAVPRGGTQGAPLPSPTLRLLHGGVCAGETCPGRVSSVAVSRGSVSDAHNTFRQMKMFHGPREDRVPWFPAAPPALPSAEPLLRRWRAPGGAADLPGALVCLWAAHGLNPRAEGGG